MEDVNSSVLTKGDDCMDLPPGFRFHPTDEEIITHYLTEKVLNSSFGARAIGEVDLNKCEPWDLPKKAKMGEKEWYFFCQRDRKYPTGMRTNRATDAGYWKATGKDKEIYKRKNYLVGMKKTLVFYRGRAPKGEKTNWVMHEYRLEGKFSYYDLPRTAKDDWVVCRVFHKSTGVKRAPIFSDQLRMNSFGEDIILDYSPLPPLLDIPPTHNFNTSKNDGDDNFNGTTTASSVLPMRSSDANQNFSYSTAMDDHQYHNQHDKKNFLPNTYTITNHQENISPSVTTVTNSSIQYHPQISLQNQAIFPFQGSPNSGYNLHKAMSNLIPNAGGFGDPDQAILKALQAATNDSTAYGLKRQCKVEQFSSNQSAMVSVSQETGVSADVNTDISSVVSKQDNMENSRSYDDLEGPSSAGAVSNLDYLWNF